MNALVLKDWAHHLGGETAAAHCVLADVKQLKKRLPSAPERIVLTTATEIAVLLSQDARALVAALRREFPGVPVHLTGLACVGFHATLLDLISGPSDRTLVVCVEAPGSLAQRVLDAIGVGQGEMALEAEPGYAWAYLERMPAEGVARGELVVRSCEILAQERGILGTAILAKRAFASLQALQDEGATRIVSFDIHSPWAKELMKALTLVARGALDPSQWLPSAEGGRGHFLTLKPLIELARYAPTAPGEGLAVTTLGAGGRLALTHLMRHDGDPVRAVSRTPAPERRAIAWQEPLARLRRAATAYETGRDRRALLVCLKDTIQFVAKQHRGVDNLVFTWDLDDGA